jgi:hypothetical protein
MCQNFFTSIQQVFGHLLDPLGRTRWDIPLHGSVINRFLREVRDATVQVVPFEAPKQNGAQRSNA